MVLSKAVTNIQISIVNTLFVSGYVVPLEDYDQSISEAACTSQWGSSDQCKQSQYLQWQGRSNEFESGEAASGNLFVFHGSKNYWSSSVTCMLTLV